MILKIYTRFHVAISLIGIFAGFIVICGLIGSDPMDGWTRIFLITTVATSVTGFFFPFKRVTPAIVVGVLSLVVLGLAIYGRYSAHYTGSWRWIYVVGTMLGQYFNVFVLVVQMFQKIPSLNRLAPTQKEPPFAIAQGAALALHIVLGVLAVLRFHP